MVGHNTTHLPKHVNVAAHNGQWYLKLNNGYELPMFGCGTWQQTDDVAHKSITAAVRAGIREIDTARYYRNEADIGNTLQELFKQGVVKREDMFISTKLHPGNMGEDEVVPALKEQLASLQLDYVDMFLIHWPMSYVWDPKRLHPIDPDTNKYQFDYSKHYTKAWKGMEQAVRLGLTRSIGLSNFNTRQIEDIILRATIRPQAVQVESHPMFANRELIDWCQDRNIAVTAYSTFGNPGSRYAAKNAKKKWPGLMSDHRLMAIAAKYPGKTPANVMLRWQLQRGVAVIPKSTQEERIKSNFNVFDFELSPSDMEVIYSMDEGLRTCTFAVCGNSSSRDYPFDECRDDNPWEEAEVKKQ